MAHTQGTRRYVWSASARVSLRSLIVRVSSHVALVVRSCAVLHERVRV